MIFNRKFVIAFLALALLLRSAAGFAMQIEMVYTQAKAIASASSQTTHPCRTDSQPSASVTSSHSSHSDCGQCCVPALLPSVAAFNAFYAEHTAPSAALFNNLPAPAQRPTNPPLV